ncbi:MAG: class I SAM-dependent methyltransferase [Alphaproteobacteria bacterium]|nr:MAG: class I SAM-dependent methyltransferase [Alphaproteobacteria bacterium]
MQELIPHSSQWYDRLSKQQEGYYYPWQSTVAEGNGEDAYLQLVGKHLSRNTKVLDVGCGHGEVALDLAPHCQTITGYDQVKSYIEIAERKRKERGLSNSRFICHDSHKTANGGKVLIPLADNSVDLIISRRGPTHWIEDAHRVCKDDACLIQLNPLARKEEPIWNKQLPEALKMPSPVRAEAESIVSKIEDRLAAANLRIHSAWTFDVAEWLHAPIDLYKLLTFGSDPAVCASWSDVEGALIRIFENYASEKGLEDRNRRFLWQARIT